jgi:hypothetical protein
METGVNKQTLSKYFLQVLNLKVSGSFMFLRIVPTCDFCDDDDESYGFNTTGYFLNNKINKTYRLK